MAPIPESTELMVTHASEAFMEDFRYAEAIARAAVALLARREVHPGTATVV
jgi:hypothetical protein